MKNGFFPIACATPPLRVADCTYNAEQIISLTRKATKNGSKLVVFPELCITGYTCGDLFLQQILLDGALQALRTILKETSNLSCICVVGLPIRHTGAIYNCAAVCYQGSVLGIVPKQHLPNYGEFYEQRHFTPGIPADGKTFWQADGIRSTTAVPVCRSTRFHLWRGTLRRCLGCRYAFRCNGSHGCNADCQSLMQR